MQPIHLAIGIVEGFVTAGVINYVRAARPEILDSSASSAPLAAGISLRNVLIGFVALAVVDGRGAVVVRVGPPRRARVVDREGHREGGTPRTGARHPGGVEERAGENRLPSRVRLQTGGERTEGEGAGDARLAERRRGHLALGPDRRRPGPRGGVRDRMGDPGVRGEYNRPGPHELRSRIFRHRPAGPPLLPGHGRPPAGPARQGGRHVAVRGRGRLLPEVRGPVAPPLLPVPGPDRGPRRHPGRFHREESRRRLPLRGVRRDLQPPLRPLDGRDRPRRLGSPPAGSPSRRSW